MATALRQAYRRYVKPIPNPAVGAELNITPDGQGGWRVVYFAFSLTTSAVVAARTPSIRASDGTVRTFEDIFNAAQAAASTVRYVSYPGCTPHGVIGGLATCGMPDEGIILGQGWSLASLTTNIDPGDQFSNVSLIVEELATGPDYVVIPTGLVDVQPLD